CRESETTELRPAVLEHVVPVDPRQRGGACARELPGVPLVPRGSQVPPRSVRLLEKAATRASAGVETAAHTPETRARTPATTVGSRQLPRASRRRPSSRGGGHCRLRTPRRP